jgi:hypothetical protein
VFSHRLAIFIKIAIPYVIKMTNAFLFGYSIDRQLKRQLAAVFISVSTSIGCHAKSQTTEINLPPRNLSLNSHPLVMLVSHYSCVISRRRLRHLNRKNAQYHFLDAESKRLPFGEAPMQWDKPPSDTQTGELFYAQENHDLCVGNRRSNNVTNGDGRDRHFATQWTVVSF